MTPIHDLTDELAPELAVELGLKPDEYERIVGILGRTPTKAELYMYSLMWSEHCSYKSSRKYLRLFPTSGPRVLQGPGENAGVISAGDGWAIAFKMESHNSPSAIEPYEGAATGIGGCARDIFAMGARPIALVGSMRFGTLDSAHQRWLFREATAGIDGYSRGLDVPVVAGEVYFEQAYEENCLINAMTIGVMREENLTRAQATGVGNKVVLIGAQTGREGVGGASVLASQEFSGDDDETPKTVVPAGNPEEGKRLIKTCLELLKRGLLVGLGDLGAAGLTSSASEMASRAGTGIEIDVSKVPQKEDEMQPFEIMVSETQERMLAVVEPERLDEVVAICKQGGLLATVVGKVTDTGNFVVYAGDEVHAEIPALSLAEDAPLYDPAMAKPAYLDELAAFDTSTLAHPTTTEALSETLLTLLKSTNICSRRWAYKQAASQAQTDDSIVVPLGNDAAVVRIDDNTNRALAVSSDCNGRYVYLNPYRGAQIALAEAARNVTCVGGEPAAVTDCLNFGSPEKPEVYWTFHAAVSGLADACTALDVPVVSGNVSFYNESAGVPIYPTPTIGLVGLLDSTDESCTMAFKNEGDVIILVGETADELGGSEYLSVVHETVAGEIPALDLELERDVQAVVRTLIRKDLLTSAHDCSEGGIAVALAESAIAGGLGCTVMLDDGLTPTATLFSETQSRIVVTCVADDVENVIEALADAQVPYSVIGEVGGDCVLIAGTATDTTSDTASNTLIDVPLSRGAAAWGDTLEQIMQEA
ncbi:MAG: phosphoribosylformylglycinamidine synthase subunit PurL [Coriobacteriia bacterium]|nr:phosphoribosylformylglycinamidine synthase subunit PurL [Coriobacteriia bacterium]